MTQIEHNHHFVKFQRKSKTFIEKQEGVSKAQKRPQYKSKLATLVKYT